jgi:DNA-binding IclR family transcriptional regulator
MSDLHKLQILRVISNNAEADKPATFSFNALAKTTDLSREQLDILLIELERDRFITEYAVEGRDNFKIVLHQKGLDAVQDESFI